MPLFEQVLEKYPGQVKIVYKNFPLSSHQHAQPAALAALAAAEQGRFWLYHDLLFENSRDLGPEKFLELAKTAGLDLEEFKRDMTSPQVVDQLRQDIRDGREAGVAGTPTVFINGRLLEKRTLEEIRRMIDEELAGSSAE